MGLQDHLYTLDVCLFVPNKYQNGRTDRAQILCGTSFDQREGYDYEYLKFSKINLQQIFINFWKYTIFFIKSASYFAFVLQ